jgi:4-amino-4-deoxy-L-arabinose transferase-like glycosyltransferase
VAFFSFSGSKLPTYILPAFPPLCLALGEYVARSRWDHALATRGLIAGFALLLGVVHYVGLPWYARERSPMGRPELVERFVNDPNTVVVTYPRDCNSVAFYTGRSDLQTVRTKNVNQFIVDSHFRPRTVVLFTHAHSLASFREALPPTLRVTETVSLRRKGKTLVDKLLGGSPWGLCDIAVLEPVSDASAKRR